MPTWLERDASRPALPKDELRRRRREAILIGVAAVVFILLAVFEIRLPDFHDTGSQSGNVTFFLLINLNLILLVLLIFLVTRNLVKLVLERRRGILGSRLRTRLVLAFVGLALFPTLALFLVAEAVLSSAIDGWFDQRVETALDGSLEVAHRYYQRAGNDAMHFAQRLGLQIRDRGLLEPSRRTALERYIAGQRAELNLDGVHVLGPADTLAASYDAVIEPRGTIAPSDRKAMFGSGEEILQTRKLKVGDVVRGGVPIRNAEGQVIGAVVVDYVVPRSISKAARRTVRSHEDYRQLAVLKQPLRTSYTLTFLLITLVVLFSGTWFGFYFAKGITVPIQRLGEGMREVAHGNWGYRAEAAGDEEVATLVHSFNRMTGELQTIHSELEDRHRYIRNVLANVTAGVVSIDDAGAVVTVNRAAGTMLGVDPVQATGKAWATVFQRPDLQPLGDVIARLREDVRDKIEQQVKLSSGGRSLTVWVTGTALVDEEGATHGFILFFEDVSHLLRVERMEAWREVARRIAHEIKNPLTPIQLSAQRLRKRYQGALADREDTLLDECTRTIIGQVEQLKRLVNEFSTFARLPGLELAPHDLNSIVEEAVVLFREGHPDITFTCAGERDLPLVDVDRDAIKRAVINLLDNAVAACRDGGGRVDLVTTHDLRVGVVRLEVADDGSGMSPDVKARAFEPYFSTKKEGTGLGLAIVAAIAADHQAYVRIRDNMPRGTRVVIELPLRRSVPLRAVAQA